MNEKNFPRTIFKNNSFSGSCFIGFPLESWAAADGKKLKVAVIGCGSVSNRYLPQLLSSDLIEVVGLCDIKYERAVNQNNQYKVKAQTYPNIEAMLAGRSF